MSLIEVAIRFEVRLLEETHAGSGTGRLGLVDDTHSRDADGESPVVWCSTVRGLLREAGEDYLLNRRRAGASQTELSRQRDLLYKLLGSPVNDTTSSRDRGVCQFRSLRLNAEGRSRLMEGCFQTWTSTSRGVHSRCPLEQTLRTIEMAKSGLTFEGEIRFPVASEVALDLVALPETVLLKKCLTRLRSIGGGKTRGWGQVCVPSASIVIRSVRGNNPSLPRQLVSSAGPLRLRLLLRNLEPLGLTTTTLAGNLLGGLGYLPGTTLRGDLLHWLSARDVGLATELADPVRFQVGNGYHVPSDIVEQGGSLESLELLPVPLSMRVHKAGVARASRQAGPRLPWWAQPGEAGDELGVRAEMDAIAVYRQPSSARQRRMTIHSKDASGSRARSISSELPAPSDGGGRTRSWACCCATVFRPCGSIHGTGAQVHDDERRENSTLRDHVGSQDDALFSQQVLLNGQRFLVDLRFETAQDAERFLKTSSPLWQPAGQDRSWLRLGRGGRPVLVEDWKEIAGTAEYTGMHPDQRLLVLTLASDLIARDRYLRFLTSLTPSDLVDLVRRAARWSGLAVDDLQPEGLVVNDKESVYEPTDVFGYNAATGLPRARQSA